MGISGTSAGAINACVVAQGLLEGRRGRRQRRSCGLLATGQPAWGDRHSIRTRRRPIRALTRAWNLDWSPVGLWLDTLALFVSPYQLNPLDHNPLRDLLRERLDFDRLRDPVAVKLFVCAINLKTNQMKLFGNAELSVDALLASACLPQLNRAVEVDGEFYWDGGFIGNPVLKPLLRQCEAQDIVLVQLNPTERANYRSRRATSWIA